jgi:large subunit ribosomal protein L15
MGKTSGKGHKGQKSRSGYKSKPWNEGGQMPLQRRLPKRGFTNIFKSKYQEVTVSKLGSLGIDEITPEILRRKKAISKGGMQIKVLGNGDLDKALTVKAHAFTRSAVEKIEKAGGKVEIIGGIAAPEKKAEAPAESKDNEDDGDKG